MWQALPLEMPKDLRLRSEADVYAYMRAEHASWAAEPEERGQCGADRW